MEEMLAFILSEEKKRSLALSKEKTITHEKYRVQDSFVQVEERAGMLVPNTQLKKNRYRYSGILFS
jgi:hypothetical protein